MIRYKKNSPGQRKSGTIEVDGKQYVAKYIGKGAFSRVYRVGNRVIYYTRGDCGKEVLAMYQYNRMAHLPDLTRHENITTVRGIWYVFSSPYYRDVKKSDRSAYEMMMVVEYAAGRFRQALYQRGERGIYLMKAIVDAMEEDKIVPRSVIRAMREIVDVASNCGGNPQFDLHKKNFGVNEYGTLIFRDPFYVLN